MEIKLSNGEVVLLDPEDYERVSGFQWKKHPQGYASIEFTMHRFLFHPVPTGYEIHHINGNKLDNRRENLQLIIAKEHRQLHTPAPTIKKDLTVAPLPAEVEEAMEYIRRHMEICIGTLDALAVIRAALAKGVEWERKWAELVETVASRTDQARTMEVKL